MAYPGLKPGSTGSAWLAASTPRAIRDALVGVERAEFERRYGEEMSAAAESMDLTGVLAVLDNYSGIAEMTQRQGPDVHERMLATAQDLLAGRDVPTISAAEQRARIDARLGH